MNSLGPIMLDIEGLELTPQDQYCLTHSACGGVILFARNFQSSQQVTTLIKSIREIKPDILVAVDQEGGRVQRFKQEFTTLPPLDTLGKLYLINPLLALERANQLGELMALEVLSVGCDISFTPVLDLGFKASTIIGNRAFSESVDDVIRLGRAFIAGMTNAGMGATGKHFPGHGSVVEDSHLEIPIDDRDEKYIQNNDLLVFSKLKDELKAIMPAHIVYPKVDSEAAGFSKVWLQDRLRRQIGFSGLIFSDDIGMKGAEGAGNYLQRTDKALSAGCDMVLVCNQREEALSVLEHLSDYQMPELSIHRINNLSAKSETAVGLEQLKTTQRWQSLQQKVLTLK